MSERQQRDPPVHSKTELISHLDSVLGTAVNPRAPGLIDALWRASRYANIEKSEQGPKASFSRRVVMLGILEAGLAEPSLHRASVWVTQWAIGLGNDLRSVLDKQDRGDAVRDVLAGNAEIATNATLADAVSQAQAIARETVGRKVIDLRHLVFAIASKPGRAFVDLANQPTAADLADLRALIVEQIASAPEPEEKIDRWSALRDDGAARIAGSTIASATGEAISPDGLPSTPRPKASAPPKKKRASSAGVTRGEDDLLPMQGDDPATRDYLEREPFARVLAARIRELRSEPLSSPSRNAPFMLHIHGRWGSGKSSVLNFLKARLESSEGTGEPARVVLFNAWEHNSRRPPWWPFLRQIYKTLLKDPSGLIPWRRRWLLRARWWSWRARADLLPLIIIVLVFGLVVRFVGSDSNSVDTAVKIVAAVATASAVIYAFGRSLMFGSARAAQAYSDLKADPMSSVKALFAEIAGSVDTHLVVIIDDLDRCDADYVVDLLEGIQILFKTRPVTYVAAADRKWICAAFEKRYADFSSRISEPGRPLGYLFLEKLFQISAGMPKLTLELQEHFLETLTDAAAPPPEIPEEVRVEARQELSGLTSEADIQAAVRKVAGDPTRVRAYREEGAIQIGTPRVRELTETRLRGLLAFMESNPRAMKRLVNDVSLAQSRGILEGRYVPVEARARWAMIGHRWPQFADYLADQPEAITAWRPAKRGAAPRGRLERSALPDGVRDLTRSKMLASTLGASGEAGALDQRTLAQLLR